KEKVGDRALFCLSAKTGKVVWRAPLKLNPWGGPSVLGKVVVVGGSTIGYEPKALKGAKGEVVALNLDDGKGQGGRERKGGVVDGVALAGGAAVLTATDGKVRAYELESGKLRWAYDARTALFGPPAVVDGVVYAGDLKGVIHAIALAGGRAKWTLDL